MRSAWRAAAASRYTVTPAGCPTCGATIVGVTWEQDLMEANPTLEPAWQGGPLMPVLSLYACLVPSPGSQRNTLDPCGHTFPEHEQSFTVRALQP